MLCSTSPVTESMQVQALCKCSATSSTAQVKSISCQGSSPPLDPTNSSSFVRDVILRTCLGIESSKKSVIKSWSSRDDSQSMSIEDVISLYLLSPIPCNTVFCECIEGKICTPETKISPTTSLLGLAQIWV